MVMARRCKCIWKCYKPHAGHGGSIFTECYAHYPWDGETPLVERCPVCGKRVEIVYPDEDRKHKKYGENLY